MTAFIKNWYLPPVKGMRVELNKEHPSYEGYNNRQAKGTKGTIIKVNISNSTIKSWNPNTYLGEYVLEIKWDNGHVNDYNLSAIVPLWKELPETSRDMQKVTLSDGTTIDKDANYLKNLAIAVIERGLRIREENEEEAVFDVTSYKGIIQENLTYIERRFLENDFEDFHTGMLNTLIDAKEFYENLTTQQENENESEQESE